MKRLRSDLTRDSGNEWIEKNCPYNDFGNLIPCSDHCHYARYDEETHSPSCSIWMMWLEDSVYD